MKVLQQSLGETQSKEVKTLPSHLMNFHWSLEQTWNRVRVSTVYIRTFRRTQIVISAWRQKYQGLLAEGVLVQSCPERNILVTWLLQITKFSVKKVNRGTIFDMPWWYKTWQHSGYNHTRANQNLPRRRRTQWSSWSRRGNQKSFTLTIPWNLASLARNYPGIIVRQHHTDQKHMGLPKEQCAEGHLRCYCNPVWTKIGGRIPWCATATCETFKISCLMGRHHMKGGSECPLTYQWYRLERWSNFTLFLRKTNRGCISLEQKSCQVYFSVMRYTRGETGKETLKCQRRKEVETSYSQSQMEQSKSLGENSVWEHPP